MAMFATIFAPVGTGMVTDRPVTLIMRPAAARLAEAEAEAMAAADAEDATAAALRLESAALALAELAVVIPAEHAARDRQAAAAARAAATLRYVVTALNLGRRFAMRIAIVSQACNTGPNPATAPRCSAWYNARCSARYGAHFRRRPAGSRGPGPRATRVVRLVCFDA